MPTRIALIIGFEIPVRFSAVYQTIFSDRVPGGPFRGMRHPAREVGSGKGIGARVLGTYECELWPQVEELCRLSHDGMITVGAAEGYYTVGLALRKPGVPIWAFEADDAIRAALEVNLKLNGVEHQVRVAGRCEPAQLVAALDRLQHPLVIMDIEGGERELLDPEKVPALRQADILVEVHDFVDGSIGNILKARFAASHRLTEIWTRPRTDADVPPGPLRWLLPLMKRRLVRSLDEGRGCEMRWFFLEPIPGV